jgi:hypothetical protein
MNGLTVKQGFERSYKCIHDLKVRLKFLFTHIYPSGCNGKRVMP